MRCYCTFLAPAITGGAAYGKKEEECWENSLSEAYENLTGEPRLELKVITLNINEGHNKELMEQCRTLREYAQYVAKVRKYTKEMSLGASSKRVHSGRNPGKFSPGQQSEGNRDEYI